MNTGQDKLIKFIEDQKILEGKVDKPTNITIMTLWSFRNKYRPKLKELGMVDYENPWMYEGRAFLSEDI